jgi:hypothetical protein
MKEYGKMWTKLLEASGGKLEMSKCFFYLLTWKWDNKGYASPATKIEQMHQIQQNSNEEYKFNIEQKETQISHKTLGTMKTIIGDKNDHYKFSMKKKATKSAKKQVWLNLTDDKRENCTFLVMYHR